MLDEAQELGHALQAQAAEMQRQAALLLGGQSAFLQEEQPLSYSISDFYGSVEDYIYDLNHDDGSTTFTGPPGSSFLNLNQGVLANSSTPVNSPTMVFNTMRGGLKKSGIMRHHETNLVNCLQFFFSVALFWSGFRYAVHYIKITPKARVLLKRFGFYEYLDHGGTREEKAACMRLILSHNSKDISTTIADTSGVPGQVLTTFTFIAAILITTVDFSQVNYVSTDTTLVLYYTFSFIRKLSLLCLIAVLCNPLPSVDRLWTQCEDSWEKLAMSRAQVRKKIRSAEEVHAFIQSKLHNTCAMAISALVMIHFVMVVMDLANFFCDLPHYKKSFLAADTRHGEFHSFLTGGSLHHPSREAASNFVEATGGSRCKKYWWNYNPLAALLYCGFPAWILWLLLTVERLMILVINMHTGARVLEHFSNSGPGAKATMQGFRAENEFFKTMLRECACAAIAGLFAPYGSYDCYSFFYYKISAIMNPDMQGAPAVDVTSSQRAWHQFSIVQNFFTRILLLLIAVCLILGNLPWLVWRVSLSARDFDYTDAELERLFDKSWGPYEQALEDIILDEFVKNDEELEDLAGRETMGGGGGSGKSSPREHLFVDAAERGETLYLSTQPDQRGPSPGEGDPGGEVDGALLDDEREELDAKQGTAHFGGSSSVLRDDGRLMSKNPGGRVVAAVPRPGAGTRPPFMVPTSTLSQFPQSGIHPQSDSWPGVRRGGGAQPSSQEEQSFQHSKTYLSHLEDANRANIMARQNSRRPESGRSSSLRQRISGERSAASGGASSGV